MKTSKKILIITALILAITILLLMFVFRQQADAPGQATNNQIEAPEQQPETQTEEQGFDKAKHSLTDPDSIWVIANKAHALPDGFTPDDLSVPDVRLRLSSGAEQMKFSGKAIPDLESMFKAAAEDKVTLVFGSGFRSYALQKQFYDSYVARDGQAAANRYSARPGTSEHQTGLSFDATRTDGKCHLDACFADTPEGRWMTEHAHKYGFVLRYPDGKEGITGYRYEPWHFRYVGKELAAELKAQSMTLEEFFEL